MVEAICCRIRFAFLLGMFSLPILVTIWNRHLDAQIEQSRYLPPLAPAMHVSGSYEDAGDATIAGVEPDELPQALSDY